MILINFEIRKMYKTLLFGIFLVFVAGQTLATPAQSIKTVQAQIDDSGLVASFCDGDGWTPYVDEKCFKLIKVWANRTEAYDLCRAEQIDSVVPELISIKSAQEQAALEEFIFGTSGVKVNVWIGAKRVSGQLFEWDDDSSIDYSNWVEGGQSAESERECVEMQSRLTTMAKYNKKQQVRGTAGKWRDVTCERANYVVCQKLPRWTLAKVQQTLIDTRKNQVPIGFVYIQLSDQPAPQALWPRLGWDVVTQQFSGLFADSSSLQVAPEAQNDLYLGATESPESPVVWKRVY